MRRITKHHKELAEQIVNMLGAQRLWSYDEICRRMKRSPAWTSATMRRLTKDGVAQTLTHRGRKLVTLHPSVDAMAWDAQRHWVACSLVGDLED